MAQGAWEGRAASKVVFPLPELAQIAQEGQAASQAAPLFLS